MQMRITLFGRRPGVRAAMGLMETAQSVRGATRLHCDAVPARCVGGPAKTCSPSLTATVLDANGPMGAEGFISLLS